jgi:hypothetical protein
VVFDQLGAFLVGVLAIALAAPCLFAAVTERALQAPIPRAVVALAAGWALAFLIAAIVVVVRLNHIGMFGLLVAAAELLAAAAIWAARAEGSQAADDGPGGGRAPHDEPPDPSPHDVPDEYWSRWEASLR